jgi:hypothetical protein
MQPLLSVGWHRNLPTTPRLLLLQEWCEWYAEWCDHRRTLQHSAGIIINTMFTGSPQSLTFKHKLPRCCHTFFSTRLEEIYIWHIVNPIILQIVIFKAHQSSSTQSHNTLTGGEHFNLAFSWQNTHKVQNCVFLSSRTQNYGHSLRNGYSYPAVSLKSGDNVRETLGLPHCHF